MKLPINQFGKSQWVPTFRYRLGGLADGGMATLQILSSPGTLGCENMARGRTSAMRGKMEVGLCGMLFFLCSLVSRI